MTEIVTDTLTLVPKLTLLTLSSHVESTTYVLSIAGSCIRLTGLSAIIFVCSRVIASRPAPAVEASLVCGGQVSGSATKPFSDQESKKPMRGGVRVTPSPCFLEVLILGDFKSLFPEVLILRGFKSLFPEVLILVSLISLAISRMREFRQILEVLILGDFIFFIINRSERFGEFVYSSMQCV